MADLKGCVTRICCCIIFSVLVTCLKYHVVLCKNLKFMVFWGFNDSEIREFNVNDSTTDIVNNSTHHGNNSTR